MNLDLPTAVIRETYKCRGDITSKYMLSSEEVLETCLKFLGEGYSELGKKGSGVFRSSCNLRQTRLDINSIIGKHNPFEKHFHLEMFKPGYNDRLVNNHIMFYE